MTRKGLHLLRTALVGNPEYLPQAASQNRLFRHRTSALKYHEHGQDGRLFVVFSGVLLCPFQSAFEREMQLFLGSLLQRL